MTPHSHERRDPHHPLRRITDYRPDGSRTRRWSRPERFYRLTYRRRPFLTFLSTVIAVLLPAAIVIAGTQLAPPTSVPERKTPSVSLNWAWDDGAPASARVFLSSDYRKHYLPTILVQVPPADVNFLLHWQFLQDGTWEDEYLVKANAAGLATIPLDPYCADASWCDGTYQYRMKIGKNISYVDLSFWDR